LKAKKQTAQQKQAYHAVSLFYELVGPISFERLETLENKEEKLARKKDNLDVYLIISEQRGCNGVMGDVLQIISLYATQNSYRVA
jgi:hypothetical protein